MSGRSFTAIRELRRLTHAKSVPPAAPQALGEQMVEFFRKSVSKRQTKLVKLAEAWANLVPETLSDHWRSRVLVGGH